jgi:hypothetical protein
VGLANELAEFGDPARAIDLVGPIVRERPSQPYGIVAAAHLALARAHERANDRRGAAAEYRAAIETAPRDDPEGVRSSARTALARLPSAR